MGPKHHVQLAVEKYARIFKSWGFTLSQRRKKNRPFGVWKNFGAPKIAWSKIRKNFDKLGAFSDSGSRWCTSSPRSSNMLGRLLAKSTWLRRMERMEKIATKIEKLLVGSFPKMVVSFKCFGENVRFLQILICIYIYTYLHILIWINIYI